MSIFFFFIIFFTQLSLYSLSLVGNKTKSKENNIKGQILQSTYRASNVCVSLRTELAMCA